MLCCMALFPGPLQTLCESEEMQTVEHLKQAVNDSEYGARVVDYLLLWFETWKTHGTFIPCFLTRDEIQWCCWDLASATNTGELLYICALQKQIKLLDWCYDQHPGCFQLDWTAISEYYANKGDIIMLQWLKVRNHLQKPFRMFEECCFMGHLSVAQWLYDNYDIDIYNNDNAAFDSCIASGHLPVLQWLYGLGVYDIHMYADEAFRSSCRHGHLDMAKWIYSLGKVDIHPFEEEVFRLSCANGHLHTAQWLYHLDETRPINIHARDDYAFCKSCANGHLSVAQWLHQTDPISDHSIIRAFQQTDVDELDILKWLYTLKVIPMSLVPPRLALTIITDQIYIPLMFMPNGKQ